MDALQQLIADAVERALQAREGLPAKVPHLDPDASTNPDEEDVRSRYIQEADLVQVLQLLRGNLFFFPLAPSTKDDFFCTISTC